MRSGPRTNHWDFGDEPGPFRVLESRCRNFKIESLAVGGLWGPIFSRGLRSLIASIFLSLIHVSLNVYSSTMHCTFSLAISLKCTHFRSSGLLQTVSRIQSLNQQLKEDVDNLRALAASARPKIMASSLASVTSEITFNTKQTKFHFSTH